MTRLLFIPITLLLCISFSTKAQIDLSKKIPGIKYEKSYHFNTGIEMEIEFYHKNGNLQTTIPYTSYYTPNYQNICIRHQQGNTVYQTLFDMPNNNCLIILGEGNQMMGSASVMKDNEGRQLKELPLNKTNETKTIAGQLCNRYTFDTPEFSGELWATTSVDLPNDVGIFKASKTGKYYEKLPITDFVMEITSTTPKGKKTVMKTKTFFDKKSYTINIPDEFGVAINKIDYFDY